MSLFDKKEKEKSSEEIKEKEEVKVPQENAEVLLPKKEEISQKEEDSEENQFPMVITENQLINMKLDEILKILTEK